MQGQPATDCALPRAIQHELQSNLQIAATCAGLGGAQERPSCEPRPTATSARPGTLSKRYMVFIGQMLLV